MGYRRRFTRGVEVGDKAFCAFSRYAPPVQASRSLFRRVALPLVLACLSTVARAEDAKVDTFDPAPDQLGFTGFPGTRTPGPLGFDGSLYLDYSYHTLEGKTVGEGNFTTIDHRLTGQLSLQLGLWSRGALALRLPVLFYQDTTRPGPHSFATSAIGNPALDGRIRVLGAPVRPDGSVQDGAALAVRGIFWFPVSTDQTLFTEGSSRAELSLIGDVETFGIGAGLTVGYRYRFDDVHLGSRRLGDQLHVATGVRIPLPLFALAFPGKVQESALVEIDAATDPQNFFTKATTPVEARVSYRAITGDFFTTIGFGAGFLAAVGSPDFRGLVSFGWSPRKHDQDADGVPDGEDFCVHLPEDRDGFKDEDGCADDDNDGDLIVDEDDRCPMEAAELGMDEDEDGCTDK